MEILITKETAIVANEVGFNHPTTKTYMDLGMHGIPSYRLVDNNEGELKAPSQSVLNEWLRMEHFIYVIVTPYGFKGHGMDMVDHDDTYTYGVYNNTEFVTDGTDFMSYEDALEIGLREGLRLVTEENHKIIN
jgi:hypothetical protein